MNDDGMIDLLAGQVAQLRSKVEELEGLLEEARGDTMDDVFLHIKGGTVGGGAIQGAFRFEGNKITHCHFYAAHRIVELQDVSIGDGQADGTWYLNVNHDNLSGATVGKTAGANNDDNTSIKLFEIADGAIKKDYRGMPFVPIYA